MLQKKRLLNELENIDNNYYKRPRHPFAVDSEIKSNDLDDLSQSYAPQNVSNEHCNMITSSELNSPVVRGEYGDENSITGALNHLGEVSIRRRRLSQDEEQLISPHRSFIQHSVDYYFAKPSRYCTTAGQNYGDFTGNLSSHMDEAITEEISVSASRPSVEKSLLGPVASNDKIEGNETTVFQNCCRCCLRKVDDSIWLQECSFCMKISCSRCTVPCESCYEMFCNKCSTTNYQNAFERIFCVDCDNKSRR